MDTNCATCFYGRQALEGLLVCVKRAPFHGDETGDRGVWPTVSHGDYCGDWKSALDTTPQRTAPDVEPPAKRPFILHRDDVEFLAAIFQYPDLRDSAALALNMDTLPETPVTEALKAFLVATTEEFDNALKGITNTDTQHLIAHAASEGPIPKDRAAEVISIRVTAMARDGLRREAEGLLVEVDMADKNKDWDELRRLQKRRAELVRCWDGL